MKYVQEVRGHSREQDYGRRGRRVEVPEVSWRVKVVAQDD